jgi:hypothetical protein
MVGHDFLKEVTGPKLNTSTVKPMFKYVTYAAETLLYS